jgi:hypothetical protein
MAPSPFRRSRVVIWWLMVTGPGSRVLSKLPSTLVVTFEMANCALGRISAFER